MSRRLSQEDRQAARSEALKFLREHEFAEPPLLPERALAVRQLSLFEGDLEEVLLEHNLDRETARRIDALLQVDERLVALRRSLTQQQQKWGSMHEVAHDYLAWHKDLLFFCSILRLPPEVRNRLEAEADAFTAEAFFFGDRFDKEVRDYQFGLAGPKELAESRYLTSYYATFRRYVEGNQIPCALLVWGPEKLNGQDFPEKLVLKYYVKSPSYHGHIPPGQKVSSKSEIWKTYADEPGLIRSHQVTVSSDDDDRSRVIEVESFSNSYTVFTLIRAPEKR